MTSAARLTGNGLVEVNSPNAAAFNGFGGSLISASGGDLTIRVLGGGGIVLPPLLNVLADNSSLTVEGPFFLDDLNNVNLGMNTLLNIDSSWNLAGTLNADPGVSNFASILGASFGVDGAIEVDSGELLIGPSVTLRSGSTVNVAPGATLSLNASHFVSNGQSTTVNFNGALRIDGTQLISAWNGDIDLIGGSLEVNEPQVGSWDMDGDLTLIGGFAGSPPSLDGNAPMRLSGNVLVLISTRTASSTPPTWASSSASSACPAHKHHQHTM